MDSSSLRFCRVLFAFSVILAAHPAPAQDPFVLNEILASNQFTNMDDTGDPADWVEVRNVGAVDASLAGYGLSDDEGDPRQWQFPDVTLSPGEYFLVWCSGKDRTTLSEETIENRELDVPFVPSLVSLDAEWRYLLGNPGDGGPPAGWQTEDFDDNAWSAGKPGFGYEDDDDVTIVPEDTGAVFLRHTFQFDASQDIGHLVLRVGYDDGFITYLNGTRILNVNFPEDEEPTFASIASQRHENTVAERIVLTPWLDLLKPGENVIAMVLLNLPSRSNDLSLIPELGIVPRVYHTNFRLNSDGETLLLAGADGNVVDRIEVPPQIRDQSYGRSPDGFGDFRYHLEPSPLAENSGPASTALLLVADLIFSVERGFYDEPFDVEITTPTAGAEIRFSLDGSAPTATIGSVYEGPISVDSTTLLRAAAFVEGLRPTDSVSHTYLFLDDIVRQDFDSLVASGLPTRWRDLPADYGMDPDVVGQDGVDRFAGKYAATIVDDLKTLPAVSIVMNMDDFLGPNGIYVHSVERGPDWERPASVEFFRPDGSEEFQINCGIRVHGGAFRSHGLTKKHSLRLLFKGIYGPTKLRFPLYSDPSAVDAFDNLVLRAGGNDSWGWAEAGPNALLFRDSFGRGTQIDMGGVASHERFVHVYVNGMYWGLYGMMERPDAQFSADYFGGVKEEWDALSNGEVKEGDSTAWSALFEAAGRGLESDDAYQAVQGNAPDGSDDPELEALLDVDNYIRYMITQIWVGNMDWPANNWWVGRRRVDSTGFRFYMWDSELSLGLRSGITTNQVNVFEGVAVPYAAARGNAEFRLRFADQVHRYFFNGGALYTDPDAPLWDPKHPERNVPAARFARIADTIDRAIVAESARWGDQRSERPFTRDENWARQVGLMLAQYMARRSGLVLDQFRNADLYPNVAAPTFSQHGGAIAPDFALVIQAAAGTLYSTTDGTDPRLPGGDISSTATETQGAGSGTLVLGRTTTVRARALLDGTWSALNETTFVVEGDQTAPLRITEIMYHASEPPAGSDFAGGDFDFLELQNVGAVTVNLTGVELSDGIRFDFSNGTVETLAPGASVVVVKDRDAFGSRYDTTGLSVAGEYDGNLSNQGELLRLESGRETILEFTYSDQWHPSTDGDGHSLVILDSSRPVETWNEATSWGASRLEGGSPGTDEDAEPNTGGMQLPGDANQSGALTVGDAVVVLLALFTSDPPPLPCEGSSISEGGNRTLLDVNADNTVNVGDPIHLLDYLFRRGPQPELGIDCTRIKGCTDVCPGA